MNTKEVCKRLGVTPKMLRVYEEHNLIQAQRQDNNYRNYDVNDLLQIQVIATLRSLGFSIKEIRKILDYNKSKQNFLYSFYIQLKAVETKIKDLNDVKKKLFLAINEILHYEGKINELTKAMINCLQINNKNNIYEEIVNRWNFDEMAVDYVNRYLRDDIGYSNSIKKTEDLLIRIGRGKSIIDIGGGTCKLWENSPSDYNVTVLDKSLQMILSAKEKIDWPTYVLDDILEINTEEIGKFDIVVSTFTIHHIEYGKQRNAIENMLKLCHDDGLIIIVDRSFENLEEKLMKEKYLEEQGDLETLDTIQSEYYLLRDDIIKLIEYLGYNVKSKLIESEIRSFVIYLNPSEHCWTKKCN